MRLAALLSLESTKSSLPAFIERTCDVAEAVRLEAYRIIPSSYPVTALSVEDRVHVIFAGMTSPDRSILEAAYRVVRIWLRSCHDHVATVSSSERFLYNLSLSFWNTFMLPKIQDVFVLCLIFYSAQISLFSVIRS